MTSFQAQMRDNWCWGCGADNPNGLHLESEWDGDVAVATWTPSPDHAAGPRHLVNGGIIATLLDCHGICTAVADAYERAGRAIGSEPDIWYATAAMSVEYLRPTPIDGPLSLRATVREHDERRTTLDCLLAAAGKHRARAVVEAVLVPASWKRVAG